MKSLLEKNKVSVFFITCCQCSFQDNSKGTQNFQSSTLHASLKIMPSLLVASKRERPINMKKSMGKPKFIPEETFQILFRVGFEKVRDAQGKVLSHL